MNQGGIGGDTRQGPGAALEVERRQKGKAEEEGQGGIDYRSIAGDCDLALEPGFDTMSGLVAATSQNHPNPIM